MATLWAASMRSGARRRRGMRAGDCLHYQNNSGGVKPLLDEDKSKKLFEAADLQGGVLVWAGESGETGLLKDDPVDAVELLEMEKVGAG
jgi:hypothetical protein